MRTHWHGSLWAIWALCVCVCVDGCRRAWGGGITSTKSWHSWSLGISLNSKSLTEKINSQISVSKRRPSAWSQIVFLARINQHPVIELLPLRNASWAQLACTVTNHHLRCVEHSSLQHSFIHADYQPRKYVKFKDGVKKRKTISIFEYFLMNWTNSIVYC